MDIETTDWVIFFCILTIVISIFVFIGLMKNPGESIDD